MFRTLALFALSLPLTLGTVACGSDDGPSCAKLVDHIGKVMGVDIPADQRGPAIAKCEKEPASKRTCAMKATTPEQLMACK